MHCWGGPYGPPTEGWGHAHRVILFRPCLGTGHTELELPFACNTVREGERLDIRWGTFNIKQKGDNSYVKEKNQISGIPVLLDRRAAPPTSTGCAEEKIRWGTSIIGQKEARSEKSSAAILICLH